MLFQRCSDAMLLQEIPALPFSINLRSATEWLDRLPVGNIRECCRLFFPVIQALSVYPMEPRLRFDILEQFRPVLFGAARGLQPYFVDQRFPLDGKTRKIAGLSARFHWETALGYRQLVEASEFADIFAEDQRILVLSRALEHLAHGQLRAAQVYEAPSSAFGPSLKKLYWHADSSGLLDAAVEREPPVSLRQMFAAIMLFRLAAPGRLAQADMQHLFDRLWLRERSKQAGPDPDRRGKRVVFWYDPADLQLLVPGSHAVPPGPGLSCFSLEKRLADPHAEGWAHEPLEPDPLERAAPRLGEILPCRENAGKRPAVLNLGLASIASMLRGIEARRSAPDRRSSAWSKTNDLELAPLGSHLASQAQHQAKFAGRISLADLVAAAESAEDKRTVDVVATELPGFYLIDSERWMLRAGVLAALNSGDEYIQLGIVRGGQIRDGRFWHSFELLGAEARPVSVGGAGEDLRSGLWLRGGEEQESTLIVPPAKWHRTDIVSVHLSEDQRIFRIAKLVEAGADFHQFTLVEISPAEAAG